MYKRQGFLEVGVWNRFKGFWVDAVGFSTALLLDLNQSGLIDGCSHITSFYRLILPLAKPGIVTITIFNFIGYWNEYILSLIHI